MLSETLVKYFEKSIKKNWNINAFTDYEGSSFTFGDVGAEILRLHSLYEKYGIKDGDKIALMGRNSANWAITYLATVSYGAVIVPILPDFPPSDTIHLIQHSESVLFFCADKIAKEIDFTELSKLKAVFSLGDFTNIKVQKGYENINWSDTQDINLELLSPDKYSLKRIPNDHLAAIVYTSGTSGFSKGVMLSHNSLAANVKFAMITLKLEPADKIVSFLPLAHAYGCAFEFLYPFSIGCSVTLLSKIPSPQIIISVFKKVKPNLILTVPLIIEKIYKKKIKPVLDKPAVKAMLFLPGLRNIILNKIHASLSESFGGNYNQVVIGGAALNKEVDVFLRRIGFVFTIGYGMTECGPLISYAYPKDSKLGSCGKAINFLEVKIDSHDPENEVGEILVKGENVMNGYYKNESATKETIDPDGWMHTGDLGTIDKHGYIYIKGRSKSMILGPSGQNIYPEEIEAKVNNLQVVQEAIVVARGGRLIALVYPDKEYMQIHNISNEKLLSILEVERKAINEHSAKYTTIAKMELVDEEFEKTPKKSIKRYLYTIPNQYKHRVDDE